MRQAPERISLWRVRSFMVPPYLRGRAGRCVYYKRRHYWHYDFGLGGFMASGAKNQLPLVNDLGAPTLRDGSVGRWDGKESFFPDGFDVGGHP